MGSASTPDRQLILHVVMPDKTEQEFFVQRGMTVGRIDSNIICIDHPDVERIHARVSTQADGTHLLECQTDRAGVLVDGETQPRFRLPLLPGTKFQIGPAVLACHDWRTKTTVRMADNPWQVNCPRCRGPLNDIPQNARACPQCSLPIIFYNPSVKSDGKTGEFTGWLPTQVGPYTIRKFVAEGGMGIVLRGLHKTTDRFAAVKLLRPSNRPDPNAEARFAVEVASIGRCVHPNIVRLQDSGRDQDLVWLAMDWFDGKSLESFIASAKAARSKQFSVQRVGALMTQIVTGLFYLHGKGLIHRDLKPSNILVGPDELVKITDFGIAKDAGPGATRMTMTGAVTGSAGYMSPEQQEGRTLGPETDVFSLGVLWYELLTLRRPVGVFQSVHILRPDCPAEWDDIIVRCLNYDCSKRPKLGEILAALRTSNDAPTWASETQDVIEGILAALRTSNDAPAMSNSPSERIDTSGSSESSPPASPPNPPPLSPHMPASQQMFGASEFHMPSVPVHSLQNSQHTPGQLVRIARRQRQLNFGLLIMMMAAGTAIVVGFFEPNFFQPDPGGLLFSLRELLGIIVLVFIVLVYCLADSLGSRAPLLWSIVAAIIPFIGWFVSFGALTREANRRLASAGVRVGFLGANRFEIQRLAKVADLPTLMPSAEQAKQAPLLWNPNATANWSLLFSPLFSSILIALNYRQLGLKNKSNAALIWGIAVVAITMVSGEFAPIIGFLGLAIWYYGSAKPHIRFVSTNFGGNYIKRRWRKPILYALFISLLLTAVGTLSTLMRNPTNVPYGKDNIIYYHDATRADVDALAKALQVAAYFGTMTNGVTVLLDKKGDAITISFVVKPEKADDPATKKFFHDLAVAVVKSVSGKLTSVKLVDEDLNEKQSIDADPVGSPVTDTTTGPSLSPIARMDPDAERSSHDTLLAGLAYYNGTDGGPKDYGKAMSYFRKAADAGYVEAMNDIGFLYDRGLGVDQDYQQAMVWYRKAADAGNAEGMNKIGVLYYYGQGVAMDYQQAMAWWRKAADASNADAMGNIGGLYQDGDGVDRDQEQAISWYRKAAALGEEDAKKRLTILGAQ